MKHVGLLRPCQIDSSIVFVVDIEFLLRHFYIRIYCVMKLERKRDPSGEIVTEAEEERCTVERFRDRADRKCIEIQSHGRPHYGLEGYESPADSTTERQL